MSVYMDEFHVGGHISPHNEKENKWFRTTNMEKKLYNN